MEATAIKHATSAGLTRDQGAAALKSEDFFKLLITEMKQQDPLQPTKTADMISQVSQIRNIELSSQLAESLDQLSKTQRTSVGSALIGKFVTAHIGASNGSVSEVSGIVTGVRFDSDGTAYLELDTGSVVKAEDVVRVASADEAPAGLAALLGNDDPPTGNAAASPNGTDPANDPTKSESKSRRRIAAAARPRPALKLNALLNL
jgi:flagellar basal-body rod modification protein FlgD